MFERASTFAISTCRHCAYAALAVVVALYNAWLELKYTCAASMRSAASRLPGLPAVFKGLATAGGSSAGERGSAPRDPAVLGVVVTHWQHDLRDDQAVCRLLAWVLHHGFRQVFLYDPGGVLQRRQAELRLLVHQAALEQRIEVWAGWRPPAAFGSGVSLSCHADRRMGVALLSAADAEWPLLAAVAVPPPKAGSSGPGGANGALDEAVAAPVALRERLGAVAGSMAELEPDLVLVFGYGLTLAGYPAWAARTAELYGMGRLSGLTAGKLAAVLRRFRRTRQRFGR